MKEFTKENYNLKPYYLKRLFWFVYGLYYEGTLLYYGGGTRMTQLQEAMNCAFANGIAHAITINS